MPILSLKYGSSNVNAVHLNEENELSTYFLGYGYSKGLYSHFYSEKQYYSDIVEHIISKLEINSENLEIIATGFPQVPNTSYSYKSSLTLDQLYGEVEDFEIMSLSNGEVFTQNGLITHEDSNSGSFGRKETNYLLNLSIYKNAFPTRPSDYNLVMSDIWSILNNNRKDAQELILNSKPIVFFGEMIYKGLMNREFKKIAYLYFISMIANPGVYSLKVDSSNLIPHFLHLKKYNVEYSKYYEQFEPKNIGTLINSPGETSCLVSTELGTSQLMDIKENKIFFIPLDKSASARVVVKSQELGSVEKTVDGGRLGIIIDTRPKHDLVSYDYNTLQMDINNNLKTIHEVLSKL